MIHAGCQIKRLQNNCGEPWTCGLNRLLTASRDRDRIPVEDKNWNFFFFREKKLQNNEKKLNLLFQNKNDFVTVLKDIFKMDNSV